MELPLRAAALEADPKKLGCWCALLSSASNWSSSLAAAVKESHVPPLASPTATALLASPNEDGRPASVSISLSISSGMLSSRPLALLRKSFNRNSASACCLFLASFSCSSANLRSSLATRSLLSRLYTFLETHDRGRMKKGQEKKEGRKGETRSTNKTKRKTDQRF